MRAGELELCDPPQNMACEFGLKGRNDYYALILGEDILKK
jgi:hypothetical protein